MTARRLVVAVVAVLALVVTGLGAAAFAVRSGDRPALAPTRVAVEGPRLDDDDSAPPRQHLGHHHHKHHHKHHGKHADSGLHKGWMAPGHQAAMPPAFGKRHKDRHDRQTGRDRDDDPRPCDEPG